MIVLSVIFGFIILMTSTFLLFWYLQLPKEITRRK